MGFEASQVLYSRHNGLSAGKAERLDAVIVVLCVLFGLSSSFSKVGVFDAVNKGLIALICVVILGICWNRSQSEWLYALIAVTGFLHAVAFAFPVSSKEGIATYFMFAFWVLFLSYLANNLEHVIRAIRQRESFFRWSLTIWTVVTFVSFFLPMCYKVGWGETLYFTSFTTDSFEIAPVAMFMLAIDIVLFRLDGNMRNALFFAIIPLACVFAAGTRTYLVVVILEFMLLLRLMVKKKSAYVILVVVVMAAFVALVSVTNIGAKFESATFNTDDASVFLEVFTNGRSEFWAVDMEAFLAGTPFEIVFGHGFSYVYEVNQSTIGVRLYAHNDFINILLNFGVVGLGVYFASFLSLVYEMSALPNRFVLLLFVLMWLFNAFFNMLYVYVAAVVGMGFIAIALFCGSSRTVGLQ